MTCVIHRLGSPLTMFRRWFLFGAVLVVLLVGCGSRRAVSPAPETVDGGGQLPGDGHTIGHDGHAVPPRDAGAYEGPCPVICGGHCTDTSTDPLNCGGCDLQCASGFFCQGGACLCPYPLTECYGFCVDLAYDPANCGSCGNACNWGQPCANGVCSAAPVSCQSKQWQNHVYLFCQGGLSWQDASAACKAAGKHLVTINDDAENAWVYNQTTPLTGAGWWWIGFNDLKVEGQWVWEDGSPVGYSNWAGGEPNDSGGNEDCANIAQWQTSVWNDEVCSTPASYICESLLVCTAVCNGVCVDLQYDNNNCGACGTSCDTANGFQCQWGKCACAGGQIECLGTCVDPASNPANCGNCGKTCSAGEYCASGVCFALGKWVALSAGTFVMGSPPNEPCRGSCHGNETQHTVTLTHDFEISATEVTQGEFLALMGFNPAPPTSCGPTCPAESVTWHQAASYCNALSSKAGLASCYSCNGTGPAVTCTEATAYSGGKIYSCPGYRLPTDAEWEYAYRAGSTTALYPTAGNNGLLTSCYGFDPNADKIGWNNYNATGPHPVGTKPPNAWGLYNMAGNAHEWCHDRFEPDLGSTMATDPWGSASGSNRVLRSGSWICPANEMRAACRFGIAPTITQNVEFGFRPCRTLFP